MRDVLVHVRNFRSWGHCATYAADLAAHICGSLTGVYIEPSPLALISPGIAAGADTLIAACEAVREDEHRAAKAADRFVAWAKSKGVPDSEWQVAEGDVPRSLGRLANCHDLLVMERQEGDPPSGTRELGATILESATPCIVVPARKSDAKLDHIALASDLRALDARQGSCRRDHLPWRMLSETSFDVDPLWLCADARVDPASGSVRAGMADAEDVFAGSVHRARQFRAQARTHAAHAPWLFQRGPADACLRHQCGDRASPAGNALPVRGLVR